MNTHPNPSIDTHVAVTEELPDEGSDLAVGRPDEPTPSLWQRGVKVTHKVTKRPAVVHRIDWYTNMFRAYYPLEERFSERTEWEHCRDWEPEVTLSPAELERQAARARLTEEIATLDAASLGWVTVLVDGDDPIKALSKIQALRAAGVVKGRPEAIAAAVASVALPPEEPAETRPKRGPRRQEPPGDT